MKNKFIKPLSIIFPTAALAFSLTACDVDKTQDGELPEVEIKGETKLPEYDVEGPDVSVEKKKVEMEVPTIDIDLPEEEDNEGGAPASEPSADPSDKE